MTAQSISRRDALLTAVLCYLAAFLEGLDLQSMGLAGPKLVAEFHLSHAQFGNAASISQLGLLIGSILGGRLADRFGRKKLLIGSFLAMGLFSLATTQVHDYGALLFVRLLVGLGLGGAFPNLIAICAEAVGPERRGSIISFMYAGVPMGTVIGTLLIMLTGPAFQWRWIFYIGGFGPLLLAPLLTAALPESAQFRGPAAAQGAGRPSVAKTLFGDARGLPTVLMWLSFFFTLLVVNLLTNWLNQLMASRGLDRFQSTTVLLAFGVGSIVGSLVLGALTDSRFRRWTAIGSYSGVIVSLIGLSQFTSYPLLVAAGFGAGMFAVGSQLVNYALAPLYYPAAMRGTGVGWAVAVGRGGSIFGPFLGGVLLQSGLSASALLVVFLPGILAAALAATALLFRAPAAAVAADPT